MTQPRCGNDPRAQLTDSDRQAVADFRAYLAARASLARIRQMVDAWEQRFPETIRTAAVVSALRAALERAEPAAVSAAVAPPTNQAAAEADADAVLLPPPADRASLATGLRAAADEIAGIDFHPNARARSLDIAAGLARRLRRMADETATETHARTPCSVPECDADGTGEPCTRHEREDAHAEGNHELCGAECEPAAGARQDGAQP